MRVTRKYRKNIIKSHKKNILNDIENITDIDSFMNTSIWYKLNIFIKWDTKSKSIPLFQTALKNAMYILESEHGLKDMEKLTGVHYSFLQKLISGYAPYNDAYHLEKLKKVQSIIPELIIPVL